MHIGDHALQHFCARSDRLGITIVTLVKSGHQIRVMVSLSSEHYAINMLQMLINLVQRFDTTIEQDFQPRKMLLETINHLIAQWRDLATLVRAQALENGIACVQDKICTTCLGHSTDEVAYEIVSSDVIYPDTMLDRHIDLHRISHRFDAIGHQLRLIHQTGTKCPLLYTLGRTTAVEVDFIVAPLFTQLGTTCQISGLAATQLQCNRMLLFIEIKMARYVTMPAFPGR